MDEHTVKVLEFDKVLQRLRGLCQSPAGQAQVDGLFPQADWKLIQNQLNRVSQMKDIHLGQLGFPSLSVPEITAILQKVKPRGISLDPLELVSVARILKCALEVSKFSKSKLDGYPLIQNICAGLVYLPALHESIEKSIESTGEIKDSASSLLSKLRRERQNLRQKISDQLYSLLRKMRLSSEEEIVTIRQDRYVMAVPHSDLSKVKGIVLDRSGTGQTYYIEPLSVVESNNKLKELQIEEVNEIRRILDELSKHVRREVDTLHSNQSIIGDLDCLGARARLASEQNAALPAINEDGFLILKKARHPLLDPQKVVPLNIELGKDFTTLLITGPNAGGKTVSLKTVGLLSIMLQSGLLIPAEPDSDICIFDDIFADIGEEQSIEMSLSSFSSHLKYIIRAVDLANRKTLVLLDEIGAATDPQEGAALGEAILLHLTGAEVRTIATTHLGTLKVLAQQNPRIKNGSFEFDTKTLKPTYHFRPGLPGSSYALEIASRLGLKPKIIAQATQLVGEKAKEMSALLIELDSELKALRLKSQEYADKETELDRLIQQHTQGLDRIKTEQKEIKSKTLSQQKKQIDEARVQIEHLIQELRESQAEKESIKRALGYVQEKESEIESLRKELELKPDETRLSKVKEFKTGKLVWVASLKTEAEILTLPDKNGKLRVGISGKSFQVNKDDLYDPGKKEKKEKSGRIVYSSPEGVAPSITVRGMQADEAVEKVDQYLDKAFRAGLTEVSIIHGKGTGTLRKRIAALLKNHPQVREANLADWDEGGMGVTLVKMKSN
ncbi:MAG: endonuclease MutS2 [candidate division Zixibacteria bacterium]|nr:endonuclease MutS2 [candidate division Zixibacteria bacterium]